jgi:hypothetical protein
VIRNVLRHNTLILAWLLSLNIVWLKIIGIRFSEFNLVYKPGDNLWTLVAIKNLRLEGWFQKNLFVGYPDGQDLSAIPTLDWFHLITLKIISYFIQNDFIIFSIFVLIINTLTGIFMYLAARYYINAFYSIIFASIIVLSPWRFERFIEHTFLSNLTPLACSLIIGNLIIKLGANKKISSLNYVYLLSLTIIIATSGMYWILLSTITILIHYSLNFRKIVRRNHIFAFLYILLISLSYGTNLLSHDDRVLEFFNRTPYESELYGGKLISLFLPSTNSGIDILAESRQKINSVLLMSFEGNPNLPVIGILGSFLMIFILLSSKSFPKLNMNFYQLRYLIIVWFITLLFFVSSGLGTLFSYYLSPQFRATGRFSIYLVIISTIILLHFVQNLSGKWIKNIALTGLIITSFFDLNSDSYRVDTISNSLQIKEIKSFTSQIESKAERNCKIYQLPYARFPENPKINKLSDYELFLPYLFSNSLIFSYGAVKGADVESVKLRQQVGSEFSNLKALKEYDYCGILVDYNGIEDSDLKGLEIALKNSSQLFISSTSNRWKFYTLESKI